MASAIDSAPRRACHGFMGAYCVILGLGHSCILSSLNEDNCGLMVGAFGWVSGSEVPRTLGYPWYPQPTTSHPSHIYCNKCG